MTYDIKKVFADNLRNLLAKHNYTQKYIAEKLNVSTGTVNEWVKGKKTPRMDKIQRLADLLEVPMAVLTSSESDTSIMYADKLTSKQPDLTSHPFPLHTCQGR